MDYARSTISLVDLKTNSSRDLVNLTDIKAVRASTLLPHPSLLKTILGKWRTSFLLRMEAFPRHAIPPTQNRLQKGPLSPFHCPLHNSNLESLKQWRHSSFGNYYLHAISPKSTYPLFPPSNPPQTAYATFAPGSGSAVAFVHANDLYIVPSSSRSVSPIRLTTTGSTTHFNGVPDWVYEEEVFSSDYALWWSPDGNKVAFLESDETQVEIYRFPVYNTDAVDSYRVQPYTEEVEMRYPKPGYANPIVDALVFDLAGYLSSVDSGFSSVERYMKRLSWEGRQDREESIVMEVTWVGNEELIVKEVNRAANEGSVVLFELGEMSMSMMEEGVEGTVVRRLGKEGEEGDEGWIESVRSSLLFISFPAPCDSNSFSTNSANQ